MPPVVSTDWRPTPAQHLLLTAALGGDDRARAAWETWRSQTDLTQLDGGSRRLLPLLYANLQRWKLPGPVVQPIKQAYISNWGRNQLALRQLGDLIARLEAAGIRILVLKGAALALRYYGDIGRRVMVDFDILIAEAQVDAALPILQVDGWQACGRTYAQLASPYRDSLHARNFVHPARTLSFDLHWHVLFTHPGVAYDAPFWDAAVPLQLGPVATRTLCGADHLVHLLVHGRAYDGSSQMRWLPDAILLLTHELHLDWDRVVWQLQRLEATQPAAAMLDYLRTEWAMPVPVAAVAALAATPIGYRARQVQQAVAEYSWQRNPWQMFWLLYSQYRARLGPEVSGWHIGGFLRFLQYRWLVDSPQAMLQAGWRRLRRRISGQTPTGEPLLPSPTPPEGGRAQ